MLISDADRDRVLERLKQAYVEGRLTLDELRDRTHLALTARDDGELGRPLADLPGPGLIPGVDLSMRRHPAHLFGTLLVVGGVVLVLAAVLNGVHGWPAPLVLFFCFWFFVPWRRRQRRRSQRF